MDEIFLFIGIICYVRDVIQVCKRWNVSSMDDLVDNNARARFVRQLIWLPCERHLYHRNANVQRSDLFYESELSAAYTCYASWTSDNAINAWSAPWPFGMQSQSEFMLLYDRISAEKLPKYSLYFNTEIRT
eukprot:47359_1